MFCGYRFKDSRLYDLARSHTSYVNEHRGKNYSSNQRLEFLGDSVLGLIVSEYLYNHYPLLHEGAMSKIRAEVVCEASLFDFAVKINLGEDLLLGKGEEQSGGRKRASTLSDAFEAMIAAVYLDSGFDTVREILLPLVEDKIIDSVGKAGHKDYKTTLQEIVQRKYHALIKYEVVGESGPEHDKMYTTKVFIDKTEMGTGNGKNKKLAEQFAAKEAIKRLEKGNYRFSKNSSEKGPNQL